MWDPEGWKPGNNRAKYTYYSQAAEAGVPEAMYRLALMYNGEDGFVMEEVLNPPEIKVNESAIERDIREGEADPETEGGRYQRIDETSATIKYFKWLNAAAHKDHLIAQKTLAQLIFLNL